MRLILPAALAAQIAHHALNASPRECCGLVEGLWRDGEAEAVALHPAANLAVSSERFEIDPVAHIAAQKAARANGHVLIGCYHSHPGGLAQPSQSDLAGAQEQNFIWLIAAATRMKAFVYFEERFSEIGVATGADLVTSSSKLRS